MKRLCLALLSMVLVMACSVSAMAVDLKVSGEFYAAGMYLDKTTLKKDTASDGPSTAFYFQRLRVQTEFIVSPGLSLITRFDAMERAWGATRSAPGTTLDSLSSGTRAENENIAFDRAYIQYKSPIGLIRAGYRSENDWGTVFGNSQSSVGKISLDTKVGPVYFQGYIMKPTENSRTAINAATAADRDETDYMLCLTYLGKDGRAGFLYKYFDIRTGRSDTPASQVTSVHAFVPYVMAKIGPVSIQAELTYAFGKMKFDDLTGADLDLRSLSGFIDATADFKMFYAGATFAYISGDDPSTLDKIEGGLASGGADWNPCLIMWNNDRTYWAGALNGHGYGTTSNTTFNGPMSNAWFYQVRGGVRPMDNLNIGLYISYAYADKKPGTNPLTAVLNSTYGTEVDLIATYKITDNLSYMLGVGYLFTGDYFKGRFADASLSNDYLVTNKLTFTF